MSRPRNISSFWLMLAALASVFSVAALKTKPAPEFPNNGAALDVSDWSFRKSVVVSNSGPQEIELDLDVLSHAQRDFSDLRLMRRDEQIPYLIEPTAAKWSRNPEVTVTNDPQNRTVSRWLIRLPQAHLPVAEIHCDSVTPLFERDMSLYEILHDADNGDAYQQMLARQTWTKTPNIAVKGFGLTLNPLPLTDTLILETRNGDNPPIQLTRFQFVYPVTHILFEGKAGDELYLYYGNSSVGAPHYDLSLISGQLRSVDKFTDDLGAEETLKKSMGFPGKFGKGSVVFWGMLALVVVGLLAVIARLLPKSDAQPPK